MQEKLDMDEFCRFPLTYIMEAADDISYCIADLDDAVEKGFLILIVWFIYYVMRGVKMVM